ncbi:MAG: ATP-dependent sacrificial sulfur transferase LarE [Acidimicrobiia bacterium]|nr:ATP-dependent sacrificial sulfur transferase LarE [Acidimicrobiia bacterium]
MSTTRTTSTRKKISTSDLEGRERRLHELLASFDSVVVAFSGGVDSAYLASAATRVLGDAALCVTADSPSYPDHHRQLALAVARACGLRHEIISTAEVERPDYRANPVNRCYYCKHELYGVLSRLAAERGIPVIVDGSNADDRGDYRPGRQAAREFGVRSPLDEADLAKDDIRELSRRAGLPTWDEPASACLSSRIPYHSEVTPEKLRMIERAEDVLRELGFRVCRVRHHSPSPSASAEQALARLEFGVDEMPRALEPELRARIVRELRALGYEHVTIDPQGYRMGSLNEGLRLRPT